MCRSGRRVVQLHCEQSVRHAALTLSIPQPGHQCLVCVCARSCCPGYVSINHFVRQLPSPHVPPVLDPLWPAVALGYACSPTRSIRSRAPLPPPPAVRPLPGLGLWRPLHRPTWLARRWCRACLCRLLWISSSVCSVCVWRQVITAALCVCLLSSSS